MSDTRTRHHFVFLRPCGCPFGLAEQTSRCRDEDTAWRHMYDSRAEERAAVAAGVRVEFVDHATYEERFYPLMTQTCTHTGGAV
jgi:hypothetical protein